MIETIFVVIIGISIGVIFAYFYYKTKTVYLAKKFGDLIGEKIFDQKKADLEILFKEKYMVYLEQWKIKAEKEFREDALRRSRAVLKGAVAEQLAPIFNVFGYNPSDARFIGDPVDYIIFDGYTNVKERINDKPLTIVLADIKTGKADLTYGQRRIRQGIKMGRVKFEIIKI